MALRCEELASLQNGTRTDNQQDGNDIDQWEQQGRMKWTKREVSQNLSPIDARERHKKSAAGSPVSSASPAHHSEDDMR